MGDFSEHVLFGFMSAAVVAYFLKETLVAGTPELMAALLALFAGSVLPDIDNKNAYIHRAVKAVVSLVSGILVFLVFPSAVPARFSSGVAALLMVYSAFSFMKIRHRGVTHSLSFATTVTAIAVTGSVILFGSIIPGLAMGVGLGSHLVLDRELSP